MVAIGQPFGFENTVTAGIVSAKSRSLPGDSYVPFIQTDAAVNPGNSGGPLFNLKGEVIGVNSQIFSRSGGFQGLAFAVPIDVAMQVKDEIQHDGKVSHGRLGISIQEVNQALARELRPEVAQRRPGRLGGERQPGREGRPRARRRHSQVRRQGDLALIGSAADGLVAQAGVQGHARGVAQRLVEGAQRDVGELKDATVAMAGDKESLDKAKLGIAVRPLTAEEKRGTDLDRRRGRPGSRGRGGARRRAARRRDRRGQQHAGQERRSSSRA